MEPLNLSRATLGRLGPAVRAPRYDPAAVTAGIVHLGFGGFHRAHMARYTHDLMEAGRALDWGIVGAGLMPADRRMHAALVPQDGLYTLVERSGDAETVTVIGAAPATIYAGETTAALLDAIHRASVKIVSLTVSEAGYGLEPASRRLDPDHPVVAADLADPLSPRGAIGVIVESCRRRMVVGRPSVHGSQLRQHPAQWRRA